MKVRNIIASLGAVGVIFALPAPAAAQDGGFYIGGSAGQAKAKDFCDPATGLGGPGISCDDKDTAWSGFVGYQFNRNLGLELGYVDLGEAKASAGPVAASIQAKGYEASAVLTIPLAQAFSLFGKVGAFRWDVDSTLPLRSASDTGTDLTYGAGVKFHFTRNFAASLYWQRYNDVGDENTTGKADVDLAAVGLIFSF